MRRETDLLYLQVCPVLRCWLLVLPVTELIVIMGENTGKAICLFGLSGDPPTGDKGHVGIVRALQQQNDWDEIWVLPVYRHTFLVRTFLGHLAFFRDVVPIVDSLDILTFSKCSLCFCNNSS